MGTEDEEMWVPCAENLELSKISLSSLHGVGQNIALYAVPAAGKSSKFLPSGFIQLDFLPKSSVKMK